MNQETKSSSVSATPARIALAVPALLLLIAFGWINYQSRQKSIEIERDGVETRGEIVGKYCSNHGEVSYAFTVNDTKFHGSGFCSLNCDNVAVGSPISITYARGNPTNSRCANSEQGGNNYTTLIIIVVALAVVIFRISRVDGSQR